MNLTDAQWYNQLLISLPTDIGLRWKALIEPVHLTAGEVLAEMGEVLTHVYFPNTAIISLTHILDGGESIEVAMVGAEGVVGISVFLGSATASTRSVVLRSGLAYRLNAAFFKNAFQSSSDVMDIMLRYTQSLLAHISQVSVCARHHSLNQQLSRWLLHYSDKTHDRLVQCTQEQMSLTLGVRRERVVQVAKSFQNMGLISYSRGVIEIHNKPKLRALTCECYENIYAQNQHSSFGAFMRS